MASMFLTKGKKQDRIINNTWLQFFQIIINMDREIGKNEWTLNNGC